MAKEGWEVTVVEKHATPGGRARRLQEAGFSFDMGPAGTGCRMYLNAILNSSVKKLLIIIRSSDWILLTGYIGRMASPMFQLIMQHLKQLFESIEPGAGRQLDAVLKEAAYKYAIGINKLVYKPGLSITEFIRLGGDQRNFPPRCFFINEKTYCTGILDNPRLRQLMEFPVLFLGALPENTPALYSLMNYADIIGGTWYPQGGMYSVVNGM